MFIAYQQCCSCTPATGATPEFYKGKGFSHPPDEGVLAAVTPGTPGGILTMVGLVLAYQNSTGYWASWAYVWPLVAPGGVGLGLFLQGLRERNANLIKQGRNLMFIAALIFMIGFVFFESLLNLSGINDVPAVKAALPALFIVIGILLLARSIQRSRRA